MSETKKKGNATINDRNDMWCSIKCAEDATQAIRLECMCIERLISKSFQSNDNLEIGEKRIENIETMIKDLLHYIEQFKTQNASYRSHTVEE